MADRVNRGMKVPGLKAAIVIVGAGAVVAVPTLMVLRSNATTSVAPAASHVTPDARDDDDVQAQRAKRIALAKATPSPNPTPTPAAPAGGPAATASGTRPPPPAAGGTVPVFSHVFVI